MEYDSKKTLIQCGVFIGTACAFFLVLGLFTALSRKNWERGLRLAVQDVLPAQEYSVEEMVRVDDVCGNAACFEFCRGTDGGERVSPAGLALVMRVTTYYGPLPAVFVREGGQTRFAGIAYFKSSIAGEFSDAERSRPMEFWMEQADKIFDAASRSRGQE